MEMVKTANTELGSNADYRNYWLQQASISYINRDNQGLKLCYRGYKAHKGTLSFTNFVSKARRITK